ncbi:uncharacterized protein LOC143537234 [Bidens hawaiensis]|uniref:uncharacterized protein LOC143537234 n=1 Tax=Bidens hawaiensis TaxID=980011 RepID=UPI00404A38E1
MADAGERPIIPPKANGGISVQVTKLNGINYITWAIVMEAILDDQGLWEVVQPEEGAAIDAKKNKTTRSFLFQVMEGNILLQVAQYKNAREIWAALKAQFVGAELVQKATGLGHVFEHDVLVKKLLDAVPDKYFNLVASIEQTVDLDSMRFEDAVGRLKAFEERLRGRERASESQSRLLFNRSEGSYKGKSYDHSCNRGKCGSSLLERGRGQDTGGQGSYQTEGRVKFGDGSCVDICGKGKILLKSKTGGDRVLSDVYFIPSLKDNILSLGQATGNGCNVHMKEDYLLLYDDEGKLMMKAFRMRSRLYTIKLTLGVPGYVKKSTSIQIKLNDLGTKGDQGKLLFT